MCIYYLLLSSLAYFILDIIRLWDSVKGLGYSVNKFKCVISYDGTNYSGFQIQPGKRTIQGEIEKALAKMHKGLSVRIHGSGRTDTGVHAKAQTFHFESLLNLPESNWKKALNTLLPDDIHIRIVKSVPMHFHARFDALEKEYRYFISNAKEIDIFKRLYVFQYPYTLNIEAMQEACSYLKGEHDFTTFSSVKTAVKGSKVRSLSIVDCSQQGDDIVLTFRGNGFLYNMVRIMVGTLIDIGQGKLSPEDIPILLEKKDRALAGKTAPPQGLYLWDVSYHCNRV